MDVEEKNNIWEMRRRKSNLQNPGVCVTSQQTHTHTERDMRIHKCYLVAALNTTESRADVYSWTTAFLVRFSGRNVVPELFVANFVYIYSWLLFPMLACGNFGMHKSLFVKSSLRLSACRFIHLRLCVYRMLCSFVVKCVKTLLVSEFGWVVSSYIFRLEEDV